MSAENDDGVFGILAVVPAFFVDLSSDVPTDQSSCGRTYHVLGRVDQEVPERVFARVYPVHVDRVMAVIVADVEVAVPVLPHRALFAPQRGLLQSHHRPDGLWNDDVAVRVDKLHGRK